MMKNHEFCLLLAHDIKSEIGSSKDIYNSNFTRFPTLGTFCFLSNRPGVHFTCLLQQWNARKEITEGSLLINTPYVNPHVIFRHLSHISETLGGIHRTLLELATAAYIVYSRRCSKHGSEIKRICNP